MIILIIPFKGQWIRGIISLVFVRIVFLQYIIDILCGKLLMIHNITLKWSIMNFTLHAECDLNGHYYHLYFLTEDKIIIVITSFLYLSLCYFSIRSIYIYHFVHLVIYSIWQQKRSKASKTILQSILDNLILKDILPFPWFYLFKTIKMMLNQIYLINKILEC